MLLLLCLKLMMGWLWKSINIYDIWKQIQSRMECLLQPRISKQQKVLSIMFQHHKKENYCYDTNYKMFWCLFLTLTNTTFYIYKYWLAYLESTTEPKSEINVEWLSFKKYVWTLKCCTNKSIQQLNTLLFTKCNVLGLKTLLTIYWIRTKKIQFHNHFNPHKTLNLFAIKFNKNSINNVLIIKIYVPW